jgi:hypothetical protein
VVFDGIYPHSYWSNELNSPHWWIRNELIQNASRVPKGPPFVLGFTFFHCGEAGFTFSFIINMAETLNFVLSRRPKSHALGSELCERGEFRISTSSVSTGPPLLPPNPQSIGVGTEDPIYGSI